MFFEIISTIFYLVKVNIFIQYLLRKDSLVELPIIGEVNLIDKTIYEAESYLEELYSKFYFCFCKINRF